MFASKLTSSKLRSKKILDNDENQHVQVRFEYFPLHYIRIMYFNFHHGLVNDLWNT